MRFTPTRILMKPFFYILVLAFGSSCLGGHPAEKILTHQEMVHALKEIYKVEEKVKRMRVDRDSSEKVNTLFLAKTFQKLKIEDDQFKASFDYYMDRPQELELIYAALVDSLSLEEHKSINHPKP